MEAITSILTGEIRSTSATGILTAALALDMEDLIIMVLITMVGSLITITGIHTMVLVVTISLMACIPIIMDSDMECTAGIMADITEGIMVACMVADIHITATQKIRLHTEEATGRAPCLRGTIPVPA